MLTSRAVVLTLGDVVPWHDWQCLESWGFFVVVLFVCLFFVLSFLGLLQQHMEVPRLGVYN